MAQVKMRYGIDLGTTNSAICKIENGEPVIKKTDAQMDTLPSCVSFTKRRVVRVGLGAYNDLRQDKSRSTKSWSSDSGNVFLEFKRTMGLDTVYESEFMGRSYNSEELSAEVLKTLKTFIGDDTVSSAVITIPAMFKADQIAATKRAASLAGIEHCELLQEPIAASMAYGLSASKKAGNWLVFDFGGGTFDAALIKVEDGIMQVKDTSGNNYLGGKNLDYAIVDSIIIPYLKENYSIDTILENEKKHQILRDAMKFHAEQAKNQLSFKDTCDIQSQLDEFGEDDEGNEIELDMVITKEQVESVISPIFQKAIDICKKLLERNNLTGANLDSLILVGGPTYSPVLRSMLREQITPNVDTSIDPMTAVAKGAALYASGIDCEVQQKIESGTVALDLSYQSNSVEEVEFVSVRLLKDECTGYIPANLFIEFVRGDKGWSSGKLELNEIGDVVECQLMEGKSNSFSLIVYDEKGSVVPCFPNEVNIMQGIVVGSAVLPYNIGIEIRNRLRSRDVFTPLKGLEKNQPIPAVGVRNGLKTPSKLRPGIESDKLLIPIYQGESNADGTSAIYNDHVFDVVITGDDVPALVPEHSDVDITIKLDRSQLMTVEVTFHAIGETIEKEIDVKQRHGVNETELEKRLLEAQKKLSSLKRAKGVTDSEMNEAQLILQDVTNRFEGEKSSEDGKMHLLADLRRAFLSMEEVEGKHEWDAIESELRSEFERLEKANNELGNKYDSQVEALRNQVDQAIRKKDVMIARQVLEVVEQLYVAVTYIYQLMGFVKHYSSNFNKYKWTDSTKAHQLLNQAQEIISNAPTESKLQPIVKQIVELLPPDFIDDKLID